MNLQKISYKILVSGHFSLLLARCLGLGWLKEFCLRKTFSRNGEKTSRKLNRWLILSNLSFLEVFLKVSSKPRPYKILAWSQKLGELLTRFSFVASDCVLSVGRLVSCDYQDKSCWKRDAYIMELLKYMLNHITHCMSG